MIIRLPDGSTKETKAETLDIDARRALEPWTQVGDRIVRFSSPKGFEFIVVSCGSFTDSIAYVDTK